MNDPYGEKAIAAAREDWERRKAPERNMSDPCFRAFIDWHHREHRDDWAGRAALINWNGERYSGVLGDLGRPLIYVLYDAFCRGWRQEALREKVPQTAMGERMMADARRISAAIDKEMFTDSRRAMDLDRARRLRGFEYSCK